MVHMTGRAVSARIRRMEDLGVIEAFAVRVNQSRLGKSVACYVSVYMKSNDHWHFKTSLKTVKRLLKPIAPPAVDVISLKSTLLSMKN